MIAQAMLPRVFQAKNDFKGNASVKEYPATERQLSEWEYALRETNYSPNCSHITHIDNADYSSIQRTFLALIRRHESLRTTFLYSSGELKQIIHDADAIEFEVERLDFCNAADLKERLQLAYDRFLKRKLDRVNGPLIKAILARATPTRYMLAFMIDHIICDATSMQVLRKEFMVLYKGFCDNTPVALPPLDFQMKDYALWEQRYNNCSAGQLSLRYWKEELSDKLQEFSTPEEHGYTMEDAQRQGKPAGKVDFFLDNVALSRIKTAYRSESVFVIAVLVRWMLSFLGQKKLIVAIPFSSRDRAELNDVVGYLMSAVYLKVDVSNVATFRELFDLIVSKYTAALNHMWYSRRRLEVDIDSHCVAFFNNQTLIKEPVEFDVTSLREADVDEVPAIYPLRFEVSSFANGWLVSTHYRKSLFADRDPSAVFCEFKSFITRLTELPDERIQ